MGFKRIKTADSLSKKTSKMLSLLINSVIIVFIGGFIWFTLIGYVPPENTIELSSPFHSGKQIVLHGGASPFINGHFHVKPQNYAIDIVGLNKLGMRSRSISGGSVLANYVIYGENVYSPCYGKVISVVDG
jgi:hypothetical protein